MMLTEAIPVETARLPIAAFRGHLKLGRGFSDAGAEDVALEAYLRASLAMIETRTAKALLAREFRWQIERWRNRHCQPMPVAPVQSITQIALYDGSGAAEVLPSDRYNLVADASRPKIISRGAGLGDIEHGGFARIDFRAGFGEEWGAIPPDLAQAVFLLAAFYFEHRHEGAGAHDAIPFGVNTLIEGWRTVRVFGGRR
ncbi:hypothetical protein ERN12_02225 [Rhodobacteraceae bacterium]|nr:hypothetical protein ERN12_02225 [Paracoccaceae bacterium]